MDTKIHQYRLRNERGGWLADVILRSDGYFSTVSDYGNYAFWWGSPGGEFRAFVAQLEGQNDYVCSKLSRRGEWFDAERTLRNVKRAICERRRSGALSKEKAQEEWQGLADALGVFEVGEASEMDLYQFHRWYDSTALDDAHELTASDYPPDVRAFCREVMPLLAAAIREELAKEQRTPTAEVSTA